MSMKVPSLGQPGYISLVDAEAILLPHIPSLISVAQQTLALFLADPVVVRQASNLGPVGVPMGHFFPFAEITFAAVPGVTYEEADGRRFLRIDAQLILGFNKIDSDYQSCTSLHPGTKRADAWHSQLHLQDIPDVNLPRLELGYMLDATATRFERLCILHRGSLSGGPDDGGVPCSGCGFWGEDRRRISPLVFNHGKNIFGEAGLFVQQLSDLTLFGQGKLCVQSLW